LPTKRRERIERVVVSMHWPEGYIGMNEDVYRMKSKLAGRLDLPQCWMTLLRMAPSRICSFVSVSYDACFDPR
jgi:hypothetical protein